MLQNISKDKEIIQMVWEELQILGSKNKMRVKLGKGQLIHWGRINENTDIHREGEKHGKEASEKDLMERNGV